MMPAQATQMLSRPNFSIAGIHERRDLFVARDVGLGEGDATIVRLNVGGDALEPFRVHVAQDHLGALLGQRLGDRLADPARAPRDDRNCVLELHR